MWRVILFLIAVAAAAFLCLFVIQQHGVVSMTVGDRSYETSLAVALGALIVALVLTYIVVKLLMLVLRAPLATLNLTRSRRRAKGAAAISNGLIAAASGDHHAAARHAKVAERLVGQEPLALLLKAQTAQLHGSRADARLAFTRMAQLPQTRGLGLRGLYVEARRGGDADAAREHAAQAAKLDVFLPWAHEATLMAQCQAGDWVAALATLERNHRLGAMDAAEMRRAKAALLTARALDLRYSEPVQAFAAAQKALAIEAGLTPAAVTAARLLFGSQGRKAARIVEAAWRAAPHPDLAEAYVDLRGRPKASERLKLILKLVSLVPEHEEGRVALGRAALVARDFARARAALASLAEGRPTARVCLLMAEIEEAENGTTGLARQWLARAAHAPRDPAWIADGVVSPQWKPVTPEGRIGAFAWRHPAELPGVIAPFQAEPAVPALTRADAPAPPATDAGLAAIASPVPASAPAKQSEPVDAPKPVETLRPAEPLATSEASISAAPAPVDVQAAPNALAAAPTGPAKPAGPAAVAQIEAVAFPLERAPDDPGSEPPADKGLWRRLTG